jgi:MFS transporter, DHA1 family, inner membrane transport protein
LKKESLKHTMRFELPLFTIIRMISSTAFRMVYPFLPAFRDGLGVPVQSLTLAIGSRSLVAAFAGPFFATLADSRGRKTGMLLGIGLFIAGTAIIVFWPTFFGFVLAMMLATIGKVTFDPSMQAYMGDRVPYARRSFAITITELSWSGAYIVGIPLVGWVIARYGWIAPFPLLGLLIFFAGALLYLRVPKDRAHVSAPPTFIANFRAILKSPAAKAALGFTLLSCIGNEIINLVFGVWMEDSFGLKLAALGAAAAVLGIAEVSGEGLVALITDRLGKKRSIFIGLVVNSAAVLMLPFMQANLTGALVALFLFYISFEFLIVSSIPLMTEVMPKARATMMSGFFTTASIGRAAASVVVSPLYRFGFLAVVFVAIAFNLLAIWAIRDIELPAEKAS